MTVTLSLPPEIERTLKANASRRGMSLENYALEVLKQDVSVEKAEVSQEIINAPLPTKEERSKAWLAWCSSHRPMAQDIDISRESIYEGRGE